MKAKPLHPAVICAALAAVAVAYFGQLVAQERTAPSVQTPAHSRAIGPDVSAWSEIDEENAGYFNLPGERVGAAAYRALGGGRCQFLNPSLADLDRLSGGDMRRLDAFMPRGITGPLVVPCPPDLPATGGSREGSSPCSATIPVRSGSV